ncbi:MFS transporter [Niallia sp. NCCP-28]|uniref:MFS transporter n=1 Tax=Niallia sp. NCCP-28 TaxID=2934712 RepID=UPI0020BE4141|nr:MFS transporter [Niallia sp. NCCP-28]
MENIFGIFKNENYTRLFFANLASQLGKSIGLTAIMFYMLKRFSAQPFYATVTELMFSLPTLAVFLFVGVLADRLDRRKIAINCDLISCVLSVVLLFAIIKEWIALVFVLLFIRSAVSKFFQPAQQAIIQGILKKEEYAQAAGLNQMVGSIFMLFGDGLGIIIFWKIGVEGAIVIDMMAFLFSAILTYFCFIREEVRLPNGAQSLKGLHIKTMLYDFKEGVKYILNNKLLLYLTAGFFFFGIVNGGLSVMPAFIMKYKLSSDHYETYMIGLGIVFGLGMLVGSLMSPIITAKLKQYQLIAFGLLFVGIFIALAGFASTVSVYFLLIFIVALFLPIANIGIGGWLPKIIDPKMMGRVQGCVSPLIMLSQSITLGIISVAFPVYIAIEGLFLIVGGVLMAISLFYFWMLPKYAKEDNTIKWEIAKR